MQLQKYASLFAAKDNRKSAAAGTNVKAMFDVLFELGNEEYISNLITAFEAEQELRENPNGRVTEEIDIAKERLAKR